MSADLTPERIAAWASAVGADEAMKQSGISASTLGRYATGQTAPKGAALKVLVRLVAAYERKAASR